MQGQNSGQLEECIGSLDLSFQQPHKYQLLKMVFLIKKQGVERSNCVFQPGCEIAAIKGRAMCLGRHAEGECFPLTPYPTLQPSSLLLATGMLLI